MEGSFLQVRQDIAEQKKKGPEDIIEKLNTSETNIFLFVTYSTTPSLARLYSIGWRDNL
jgi:hypothetical protein